MLGSRGGDERTDRQEEIPLGRSGDRRQDSAVGQLTERRAGAGVGVIVLTCIPRRSWGVAMLTRMARSMMGMLHHPGRAQEPERQEEHRPEEQNSPVSDRPLRAVPRASNPEHVSDYTPRGRGGQLACCPRRRRCTRTLEAAHGALRCCRWARRRFSVRGSGAGGECAARELRNFRTRTARRPPAGGVAQVAEWPEAGDEFRREPGPSPDSLLPAPALVTWSALA